MSSATRQTALCAGLRRKRLSRRAAIRIASAAIGNTSRRSWKKETITMTKGTVVVVGGTCQLGADLGKRYADKGHRVVITSRDSARAQATAKEIGGDCIG